MSANRMRVATVAMSLTAILAACSSDGDDTKTAAPSEATEPTAGSTSAALSSTATPAPAGGSPCDLLTEAEVATALDTKVVEAKFSVQVLGAKQCVWANDTVPVRTYSLSISRTVDLPETMRGAGQSATTLYEASKNVFPGAQPLPGYGDDATIAQSTIMARKGDAFISATTFFGASDKAIEALKSLSKTAIDKI